MRTLKVGFVLAIFVLFLGCEKGRDVEKSKVLSDKGSALFKEHYLNGIENASTFLDSAMIVLQEAVELDAKNYEAHYFLAETMSRKNLKSEIFYSSKFDVEPDYLTTKTAASHYKLAFEEPNGYSGKKNVLYPKEKVSTEWGNLALAYLVNNDSLKAIQALNEAREYGGFDNEFLEFSRNYLLSCPDSCILFTNGDMDTYGLIYLQLIEGFRLDISIVNLSLLNMDKYIKWQRDFALPFDLTDEQIDALQTHRISASRIIYVYNMLISIIDVSTERPLCFTVNVDPQTLSDQTLSLQGLIYRQATSTAMDVDKNMGLLLKDLSFKYLPKEMGLKGNGSFDRIAINYGTLSINLCLELIKNNEHEKALEVVEFITTTLPWTWPTDAFAAQIYAGADDVSKVDYLFKRSFKRDPDNAQLIALFIGHYQRLEREDKVQSVLKQALQGEKADSLEREIRKLVSDWGV